MAAIEPLNDDQRNYLYPSYQERCFHLAQAIENKYSTSFLKTILFERISLTHSIDPTTEALSIKSCIETSAYQKALDVNIAAWPQEYKRLESAVIGCFGHWARFWCEYEIYKIKIRYPSQSFSMPNYLPMDEEKYDANLVDNIEESKQYYLTLHHQAPMPLSDSIALINLCTLVSSSQWYEILPSLDISKKGCHFILTHRVTERCNSPSIIVSSARVQNWSTAEQWLYFTPFFRNQNWKLCLPSNYNERFLNLGLYSQNFSFDNRSIKSFEDNLNKHIVDKQKICEVLRLTVSGSVTQGAFFLFLAQKRIMPLLDRKNIRLAYTVIEQPWMIRFYETLLNDGYFHSSCRKLDDSHNYTYKGFWEIPSLRLELDKLSYQSYKRRVINQVKKVKELNYV
ncbi:acyl-homoserine-lactone synthase [Vibrio amylolyticus]|uniref:acyl-homoserine-lactone synthase n=1 Tax=Vibrio amylolyticus TaxID=2847292 RepID=UPI00354E689F